MQGVTPPLTSAVEIYTQEHLEAFIANCSLPVLVDFWVSWCGPCRTVAREMEKVAVAEAGHLLVVKVNTENLPGLSRRFEIRSIPINSKLDPWAAFRRCG